jgi:hypothetical protein
MIYKFFFLCFFFEASRAFTVHCSFGTVAFPNMPLLYDCRVVSIIGLSDSNYLTGYTGNHLDGRSTDDVQSILFEYFNLTLTFIPQGIQNVFPNIIAIEMRGHPITTLTGNELYDYKNLQRLDITQSQLTHIPGNFFATNLSLRNVQLRNSRIQHVGANLLDHLTRLELISFWNNVCISEIAITPEAIIQIKENLRKLCPDIE